MIAKCQHHYSRHDYLQRRQVFKGAKRLAKGGELSLISGQLAKGLPNVSAVRLTILAATLLAYNLSCCSSPMILTFADGEELGGSQPALDLGALANLASSIGSNPQIMSAVSSLLKPPSSSSGGPHPSDLSAEQDPIAAAASQLELAEPPAPLGGSGGSPEPLRRIQKHPAQQQPVPVPTTPTPAITSPGANPLGGLMSLLPSLNLGGLSGLLGQAKALSSVTPSSPQQQQSGSQSMPQAQGQQQQNQQQQAQMQQLPAIQGNSAHAVINQVLTAYASGQIPNELIQLGLSGRVPPQIIELALNGQVPPQLIQMLITGQVPMATINAFLGSVQGGATNGGDQQGAHSRASSAPSATSSATSSATNLASTTKTFFETLFNLSGTPTSSSSSSPSSSSGNSITVPTLLGPIPIPVPTFPKVRHIGQLVGGTITNMASMIPF